MADGARFQVDSDAHQAAKDSGDYTPDGSGKPDEETTDDEPKGSEEGDDDVKISDIDPGDDDDADDTDKGDDDKDGNDDKDDDGDDKDKDEDTQTAEAFQAQAQEWTTELSDTGTLSDETRESIVGKVFAEGVPAEMKQEFLKTFEAGTLALRAAATQEVYALVGGEEEYQKMLQWGVDTLSDEEVAAFDADALGTDAVKRAAAVKGLHARMHQKLGSEPDFEPDLSHDSGRQKGEPIISSRAELVRIQKTAEYRKDPAVRKKVARQLRQSMATGKYDDGQS